MSPAVPGPSSEMPPPPPVPVSEMPPPPPPPPPLPSNPPPHSGPGPSVVTVENGPTPYDPKPSAEGSLGFLNLVNGITHILLGAVTVSALIFANQFPKNSSLSQHIYLCTLGYVLLMSQAILSLDPQTGWAKSLKRRQRRNFHWMLQIVGSSLAISGSIVRIVDRAGNNFDTPHGIVGLVAMLLTCLSLFGGIINFCQENPTRFSRILHPLLGALTLTTAITSLCLGFNKEMFRDELSDQSATLAIVLACMALVGTLWTASGNFLKRLFRKNDF